MEALNQTLFLWLNLGAQAAPRWVELAQFCGRSLIPYLLVATIAAVCVGRPQWRRAAWQALLATALASIAAWALKHAFSLPRPGQMGLGVQWLAQRNGAGFPSSHAASAAAWAVLAATGTRHWSLRALFALAALTIGWARVALGVHFPGDVLAGWITGCVCAWIVARLARRLLPARRSAPRTMDTIPPRY